MGFSDVRWHGGPVVHEPPLVNSVTLDERHHTDWGYISLIWNDRINGSKKKKNWGKGPERVNKCKF